MPDYPALNVQTPNAMNTLGSMVNVANSAQQFQRGGIQLQKEQQANQERIALQKFMSDPENFQTNGRIDLDKVNKTIPSIAPLTGSEAITKLTTLAGAQTEAISAKQKLTQDQRSIIAGPIGVLGRAGVNDPSAYVKELNNLKATNPDNPDLHRLIDAYTTTLGMTAPGEHVSKTAITASQSLISPENQQTQLSPQAGLKNTGGNLQETITQPSVGGNAPSISMTGRGQPITLSPGSKEEMGTDALGNRVINTKDAQGNITSTRPADSSGAKPVMNLPPGDLQAIPKLAEERSAVNNAASKVPEQHFNNRQIIKLADTAYTGSGASKWSQIMGAMGIQELSGDRASDFQKMQHFMALQAQNNASAMGAGTDAARAMAEAATNKTNWTEKAVISTVKVNDALSTGVDLFNRGMEAAIKSNGGNVIAKRDFQNAWSQNFDVRAMQLHNALEIGDKKEVSRIVSEVGGRASSEAKEIIRKARNLEKLSTEGHL